MRLQASTTPASPGSVPLITDLKEGIRDGSGRAEPPAWLGLTPPDLSYPPSSTGASIISAATSRYRLPSPHNMTKHNITLHDIT